MFRVLAASAPSTRRQSSSVLAAFGVHVTLIAGALAVSRAHSAPPAVHTPIGPIIYTMPVTPRPAGPAGSTATGATGGAIAAAPTVVSVPITTPIGLPAIDVGTIGGPGFSPGALIGVPGGGGTGIDAGWDSVGVRSEGDVDDPVVPLRVVNPVYPSTLASAGIEGRVELEFVVDTAGVVERGSVVILNASHHAFAGPAKDAIFKTRFRPARARGVPVRQLVRQAMTFRLWR